jgi:hypothetical protein
MHGPREPRFCESFQILSGALEPKLERELNQSWIMYVLDLAKSAAQV